MKFDLQTQFRGLEPSDFISNSVWDHTEKLGQFCDRIISCHVTVSAPHHHKHQGRLYGVQVRLLVPGGEVVATTDTSLNAAHEDVYVAVRDAFDAARRQLEDFISRQRGLNKERHGPARGKVVRIYPQDDYGFIITPDFREIYFHRNAILKGGFDRLQVGDRVRFSEEMGEKGPQVTSMSLAGRGGVL